ncbi:MAG: hypothetical protein K2X77_24550 [Candidatus Obscuribacterales bacterium]|jgi:hypothetical protein|nr:hypothetical protein [Candidatus Obscuribacterales bacterium]
MQLKAFPLLAALILILSLAPACLADTSSSPQNLQECLAELKKTLPTDTMQKLNKGSESVVLDFHLTLGTWIRNKWIRGQKSSPLVQYFSKMGISNPDDISSIILTSLWRDLHSQPIKLQQQVDQRKIVNLYAAPQLMQRRAVTSTVWNRELPLSNGTTMKLKDWKGKVIILLIAFRDLHSIQAVQAINSIKKRFPGNELQALAILHCKLTQNMPSTSKEIQESFLKSAKPDFPTVVDEPDAFVNNAVRESLISPGGMSLPETILIGKNGYMITRFQDWYPDFESALVKSVETELKNPKADKPLKKGSD